MTLDKRTMTVLKNLEWLYANKRDETDGLHTEIYTFMRGDGGFTLDDLARNGFTPATGGE